MRKRTLGRSDLTVSEYCLGTMTYGSQTDESGRAPPDGHGLGGGDQFHRRGRDVSGQPVTLETAGRTEEFVGRWLASRKPDGAVIASKITGAGSSAVPDGAPISGARMRAAVDASLARLQIDCIDIYQLHWPNRGSYHFRKSWGFDPSGQNRADTVAHMREILTVAQELVDGGQDPPHRAVE